MCNLAPLPTRVPTATSANFPHLRQQDYDPQGDYIRTWVPELARVPARRIHEPWLMSKDEQARGAFAAFAAAAAAAAADPAAAVAVPPPLPVGGVVQHVHNYTRGQVDYLCALPCCLCRRRRVAALAPTTQCPSRAAGKVRLSFFQVLYIGLTTGNLSKQARCLD